MLDAIYTPARVDGTHRASASCSWPNHPLPRPFFLQHCNTARCRISASAGRMQLLEKLGLCVKAEADSLVKVGVGLDPRRVGPKPNQVGANGIWPARTPGLSRSGPSAGQLRRPPAKGTKGRGQRMHKERRAHEHGEQEGG